MTSELLTLDQVAAHLHYKTASGALRWLQRHDVKRVLRGRRLLVRQADIDLELERTATGDTVNRARSFQRKVG